VIRTERIAGTAKSAAVIPVATATKTTVVPTISPRRYGSERRTRGEVPRWLAVDKGVGDLVVGVRVVVEHPGRLGLSNKCHQNVTISGAMGTSSSTRPIRAAAGRSSVTIASGAMTLTGDSKAVARLRKIFSRKHELAQADAIIAALKQKTSSTDATEVR
jgi:hypothetical protein